MAFPSPSLVAPSLAAYQFSYGGVSFGGIDRAQTYQLQSMPTSGMPDVAAGDMQRALDQGEFAGVDVLPGRDIQITHVICPQITTTGQPLTAAQAQQVDAAVQALGAVHYPAGAGEPFALYWQLPSGLFACMAKPRRFAPPMDINRVRVGGLTAISLFHATDPRWYAAPTKSASVSLPSPPGGLSFPVTFPVSFGGGGVGGILNVTNAGVFESRPILVFTGPCTNPAATNLSIPGSPTLAFTIALNAGDTLTVDTDLQTAVLTSAGTSAGSDRKNSLAAGSTWWNLQPTSGPNGLAGPNIIEFNTADLSPVAGTLTVQSGDAWLTL